MSFVTREGLRDIVATSVHCAGAYELPKFYWKFNDLITDDAVSRLPPRLDDTVPEKVIDQLEAAISASFERFKDVYAKAVH